jgi:hypothetical protein
MPEFTYFIITPGIDQKSYVHYNDGKIGNYIKFGDEKSDHLDTEGIRKAYMTHNPDIGVAAVMDSSAISGPYLGTRLRNFIVNTIGIKPVPSSDEWFSVESNAAWNLWVEVRKWHNRTVVLADIPKLQEIIQKTIGD